MPDFKRLQIEQDEAGARDQQVDALLEEGLDRYFNNRYEDAIHVWTRVLFLDRTHPRARAYIDRARTALAEMHRRSDELLQTSRDLLDQGRTDAARQLLTEAVATAGDDLQTAALRAHLERHERARVPVGASTGSVAQPESVPGWTWRPTSPLAIVLFAVAGLVLLVAGLVLLDFTDAEPAVSPVTAVAGSRLPAPSASEVALVRARALFVRGRLSEALAKLEGVAAGSPERPAADQLRIEIQQLLLAAVQSSSRSTPTEAIRR
jgi:tetratricopeptide (TPR) repeat protein